MKDTNEGKAKEIEGKVTDDESREAEGKTQQAWDEAKGKVSEKTEQAKQEVRERI